MTYTLRPLVAAVLVLCLAACGLDGPPPAGQVPGGPATSGFVPAD